MKSKWKFVFDAFAGLIIHLLIVITMLATFLCAKSMLEVWTAKSILDTTIYLIGFMASCSFWFDWISILGNQNEKWSKNE